MVDGLGDASSGAEPPLLEMTGITKVFPGVVALNDVDFSVRAGEVHGLVGENGAGKSTLMKVLSGAETVGGGEIRIRGEKVVSAMPLRMIELALQSSTRSSCRRRI